MDYQATLEWMFAQLPMYQRQGASAYKIDLTNTVNLVTYLKNPENKFRNVHVAGTNGKGSTSHMLASVLQESGYKVGLYTSPHLKDFRERIRVNGKVISKEYVVNFVSKHRSYFEANQLSFFEMTVGLAFQYFSESNVDIAIIEVGLGGRLDSTNIIIPEVSVITNIGLDHTQFLGNTLREIAREKAGIIKNNVPIVVGRTTEETKSVFEEKALEHHSDIYFAFDYQGVVFSTDLKGRYQDENMKTVLQTILVLKEKGWSISNESMENGFANVAKNTSLLGRWQILGEKPKVICDTAHNEDGLTYVMKQLSEEKYDTLHIVLGVVNDKDLQSVLPLFPVNAIYYFAKPDIGRGLKAKILQEEALNFNLKGKAYSSVLLAYKTALQEASNKDLIYVGGSTFVVGEII
ncbi:bifunctional folylpolyglutamate synthase/dihydrofolate synthase [Aquimarina sp. AD1]|uniref:bifunctional folylpolyglutamate synthase/dihydrofolate synthase n=1 Tax=Aquimarina sp. (strain AD1) TaxID=1714848 RepID=UPI000E4695B3|nr:folylpolyglutamate synthase/dihydrofolate synthase family protein [Aquimarina sp. AD1]AXT56549.1 bifunctional folylpolyglutamate synthase/dihydrofolate synthase [Aquimarina sp. AD1]RKN13154.1 bifunctional folylpolyglutamate synthase/dihydrofolate synthase [Aquimarina sp. AD1]